MIEVINSSVTLDEFLEILDSIDCEYEVHENQDENFRWIDCDLYGAEFIVFPIGPGPFFKAITLEAIRHAEVDPEMMCTEFNKMQNFASAIPFDLNESYEYLESNLDGGSNVVIAIRRHVSLEGGVSKDFLRSAIKFWAGMLLSTLGFFEGALVEVTDDNDEDLI